MKRNLIRAALVAAMAVAAVAVPGAARAAPPLNDSFADATVINPSSLPFTDTATIDEATVEASEIEVDPDSVEV